VDPHTGENPGNEDEEQDEGSQQRNLDNYVLMRDRAKRTTTIPTRYKHEGNVSLSSPSGSKEYDMAAYAFAIAEEQDTHEPITFQEAINSSEKDEWVHAMEEEMSTLLYTHKLEASLEMWRGFWRPRLKKGRQGGDFCNLVSKVVNKVLVSYLGGCLVSHSGAWLVAWV
ncbi:hypothetical protein Tco_0925609, partial [Tanacetum coccineum]